MGCRDSKMPPPTEVDSPVLDNLNDVRPLPRPDERLNLTVREIYRLKSNWKGIKRNIGITGVELFVSLFKTNNELQSLFKSFKDIQSDEELRANETLEKHGILVVTILDEAISNIDNVDHVIELCNRTGSMHGKFTGFTADLFWNIEQPFLGALKIVLGDRYTEQMDAIYRIAIKFILNNLQQGFKNAS